MKLYIPKLSTSIPALCCAALLLLSATLLSQDNAGTGVKPETAEAGRRYSVTERRVIKWENKLPMSVTGTSGIIYIRGEDRDDIKIKAIKTARAPELDTARNIAREIKLVVEVPMDRIVVGSNADSRIFDGLTAYVDYSIRAPRDMSLDIETEEGDADIADFDGGVEVQTASGAVRLRDVEGESLVSSERGTISIEGCPELSFAETGAATVTYRIKEKIEAPAVVIITNGGNVDFTYPEDESISFVIKAGEGEVDIAGAKLEKKTDIKLDGATGGFVETKYYVGGIGEDTKVSITTNGGNVKIKNSVFMDPSLNRRRGRR